MYQILVTHQESQFQHGRRLGILWDIPTFQICEKNDPSETSDVCERSEPVKLADLVKQVNLVELV